jgi:hypothetical protein
MTQLDMFRAELKYELQHQKLILQFQPIYVDELDEDNIYLGLFINKSGIAPFYDVIKVALEYDESGEEVIDAKFFSFADGSELFKPDAIAVLMSGADYSRYNEILVGTKDS